MQYISINKKFAKNIESLDIENVKILDSTYHDNKIKIGHLKGNKFYIRIKKLSKINSTKIQNAIKMILDSGMPNYFGFQRFGNDGDNYLDGKALLQDRLKLKDKKISRFLISAYQSFLFNAWLQKRIELSRIIKDFSPSEAKNALKIESSIIKDLKSQPHFFKILQGDIMQHYPYGRLFVNNSDDNAENMARFYSHQISPTGLLYGAKSILANDLAGEIESEFVDSLLKNQIGSRRFAWIFIPHLEFIYKEESAHGELHFWLPKGSYATILLNLIANREIEISKELNEF